MTADGMNPNTNNPADAADPSTWCANGAPEGAPCDGSRAATLRAAADGELSREQADRLAGELGEDDTARIAFDRALRGACGQAMGGVTCPDVLKDRIRAMAAERRQTGATDVVDAAREAGEPDSLEHAMADRAGATRDRSFWSGARAFQAMAAALVLGVVGVFLWQASSVAFTPAATAVNVQQASARDELVTFFAAEHRQRLANAAEQVETYAAMDTVEAESSLSERIGEAIRLPKCPKGTVELHEAGPSSVPEGEDTSGHAVFRVRGVDGEISVSLFLSPAREELGLEEGTVYKLNSDACGEAGTRVLCWQENGIAYYLVQELNGGQGCNRVLETLGLGTPGSEI